MGPVSDTDEELRVNHAGVAVGDVGLREGIHVVYIDTIMNLVIRYTHVTAQVSSDDMVANVSPLTRPIESLIHPAVETKRLRRNGTFEGQILEAFEERWKTSQFSVSPKAHRRRLLRPRVPPVEEYLPNT